MLQVQSPRKKLRIFCFFAQVKISSCKIKMGLQMDAIFKSYTFGLILESGDYLVEKYS